MRLSVSDDVHARPLHRVVAEAAGNGHAPTGARLIQNGVAGLDRAALRLRRTFVTLAIAATLVSIGAAIATDIARGSNAAGYYESAMLVAAAVALATGAVLLQLWRGLLPIPLIDRNAVVLPAAAVHILEQLKSGEMTAMLTSGDVIVLGALRVISPDLFDRPFAPLLLAPARSTRARGFTAWFGNGNSIIHVVDNDRSTPELLANHSPVIDARFYWQPADFDRLVDAAFPSSEQHERLRRIRVALIAANRRCYDARGTPPIADIVIAICRAMKDAGIVHIGLNGSDDDSWIKQMLRGKYASIDTALTKGEIALAAAQKVPPPDSRGTI